MIEMFGKIGQRSDWNKAEKPNFFYFELNKWISFDNMSDQEKIDRPKAFVCDGYLKRLEYKEAWKESFKNAIERDIILLKALPNFDAVIFEDITGIHIE